MKNCCIFAIFLTLFFASAQAASFGPVNASTQDMPPQGMASRPEKDSLRPLDDLIAITEKNLTEQKQLRRLVVEYYKVKARYLQDQLNKDNVIQMVKAAHQLQQSIDAQHLTHVFDPELAEELKFFSQIASKKGLSRP
ncbi:MAG: hypothetical protein Q8K75_09675 [Chlamydiales bacterium]|nr:hypothetical protein [Chlamydiales bacterium]